MVASARLKQPVPVIHYTHNSYYAKNNTDTFEKIITSTTTKIYLLNGYMIPNKRDKYSGLTGSSAFARVLGQCTEI